MLTARLDPALGVRVVSARALRYTVPAATDADRPPHVRAASGLALTGGRLVVVQDDAAFIATVAGDKVSALALPRGPSGRRRFEVALGNKQDKLDLEACVAVGAELWAFGSGSAPARERVAVVGSDVRVLDAAPLYRALRDAAGGALNLEGVAAVGDELWLFHRGNTGPADPGPAVVRLPRAPLADWLADPAAGPPPAPLGASRFDLGTLGGARLGFTDAAARGDRVLYLAAAESAPNAIDDGPARGSQLGVIDGVIDGPLDGANVRAAPLSHGDLPLKAEGLALDPRDPHRAWIVVDPDDVAQPAQLYELELSGPW
ncbi:MAG TPA: hypothetical protein VNO30_15910 [Kofleriaceae bacterium]|nr:hypothetical protein [Kofleriaceae bacterium]